MRQYIVIFLLFLPVFANAGIYRWVDENGQVHYGNVPPMQQKEYRPGDDVSKAGQNPARKKIKSAPKKETGKNQLKKPGESKKLDNNLSTKAGSNQSKGTESNNRKVDLQNNVKPDAKQNNSKAEQASSEDNTKKKTVKPGSLKKKSIIEESSELKRLIKKLRNSEASPDITNHENKSVVKENNKDKGKHVETTKINKKKKSMPKHSSKGNEDVQDVPIKEEEKKANKKMNDTGSVAKVRGSHDTKIQKDPEKCGFFTGFVDTYRYRIKYECPGDHCDLLKKNLERYKKKMELYCE